MATTLQLRRYNTATIAGTTGADGEVFVDTTKKTLVVQDGSTSGGTPLATEGFVTSGLASLQTTVSAALVNYTINANLTSTLTAYPTNANLTSTLTAYPTNANLTSTVSTAISNLVGGAPAILDTLGEISTALGNNSSLAVTLTSSIATKATSSELNRVAWEGLSSVSQSIVPNGNAIYSLGSPTNWWKDLYLSTSTLFLAGTPVTYTGNSIQIGTGTSAAVLINSVQLNTASSSVLSSVNVLLYAQQTSVETLIYSQQTSVETLIYTQVSSVASSVAASAGNSSTTTSYTVASYSQFYSPYDDSLNISNHNEFNFGSGDFTIEFSMVAADSWTNLPTNAGILGKRLNSSSNGWVIYKNGNYLALKAGQTYTYNSTSTPVANTWEHWAICKSGAYIRWFRNGQLDSTAFAQGLNITDNTSTLIIGSSDQYGDKFFGSLSNVRIIKGSGIRTSSYAISIPLTTTPGGVAATSVVLLTLQDSTIKDNSNYNWTINSGTQYMNTSDIPVPVNTFYSTQDYVKNYVSSALVNYTPGGGGTTSATTYGGLTSAVIVAGALTLNYSSTVVLVDHNKDITSITVINGPSTSQAATITVILTQDSTTGYNIITGSFKTSFGAGLNDLDLTTGAVNVVTFLATNISGTTTLYGFPNAIGAI
jgi:hypothetical protein